MKDYTLVYPLADILQVEIRLYQSGNDVELRGSREFKLPMFKGIPGDINIPVRIDASYMDYATSAILVRLRKHLYMLLQCSYHKGTDCTIYLLNAKDIPLAKLKSFVKGQPFNNIMQNIKPITVAIFKKREHDVKWEAASLG
jgi:hypothetical protein